MYHPILIVRENGSYFFFPLRKVTNTFLPSSDSKVTAEGFSLAELELGVPGKTKELGMRQGQLAGFCVSSRKPGERLGRQVV